MLEHGLRADRAAAERFMATRDMRRMSLTGLRQRVAALRMYDQPLAGIKPKTIDSGVKSKLVPRLEFQAVHACAQ